MIAPRHRLLLCVGALTPLTIAGALFPQAAVPAAALFALFWAVAAADAVSGVRRARQVRVALPGTVRMTVKRQAQIPLVLENSGADITAVVGLPLPAGFESAQETLEVGLPAGAGACAVTWPCTPMARGRFTLDRWHLETASPLGLWNARASASCRSELRVYPNLLNECRRLSALFLKRGQLGLHAQRVVGHGREFERLREYMAGDSYEDIHWKATARRGKPVTKLFHVERTREVYVVVDTSRLSARPAGTGTVLDRFLTASLVVGLAVEQQGDLIGLVTFSNRVKRFIRAGRGRTHYNTCRDTLYSLQAEDATPDHADLASFLRTRIRKRALLLILTDLSDPALAESFLGSMEVLCRQHLAMVFMLQQPGVGELFAEPVVASADDVYRALGGHMIWHDLRELGRRLQHKGMHFTVTEKETLSAELVTQFMSVKTRQML